MIIENEKKQKKEVSVIMTIEIDDKVYYVYSVGNEFLHVGLKKKSKLVPLSVQEFERVNSILTKLNVINSEVV